MNKTVTYLCLLSICFAQAQFKITGLVIDNDLNTPIKKAKIFDIDSKNETFTDASGKFSILTFGDLEISVKGYRIKYIEVNKDEDFVITLTPSIYELEEVIINGLTIPIKQKHATNAISLVSAVDLNRGNLMELHPILNRVSGVFMQSGTLSTNKIMIRGIGARNLFGTANIRTYFGDIPLTDGNGESSIEDLELSSLSRIEVFKGPSSSTYGVGLGGTILLQPEYTDYKSANSIISISAGSFGMQRLVVKTAIGGEKFGVNLIYGNNHTDGYRNNNEYNRHTLTITSSIYGGENDSFSLIGSYVNLKAGIPSSLDRKGFEDNPRQAAFTWDRSKGFEDVDYGILGFTWKHLYNTDLYQKTSLFTSLRNNYEPRPFNILSEKSNSFGVRSRVIGSFKALEKEWQFTVGGELFFDNYNNKIFENLYEDFPEGTGSVQGDQLSDLNENRNYYNFFAEANIEASKKIRLNFGIHLNQTLFDVEDQFLVDGEDSSGDFNFKPVVSPKIGANYTINSNLVMFTNVAHGFSTPTTSETLLPDGEFNPDIKPEIGWNYEIGTRFKLLNSKLNGVVSLYTLRVKDLLVSRRTIDDKFFAINAGRTNHNGIEVDLDYTFFETDKIKLISVISATKNDFKFKEFVDLDYDYSGNDLTGVPTEVINFGLDIIVDRGLYGNINFQEVGRIPANDANTTFSDNYELLHSKIGFKNNFGKYLSYDLFFGMNNMLNTKYASQLQINARGFGSTAPRYFYPGLPFNVYGGINIKYNIF